jgi:hypothetical protein
LVWWIRSSTVTTPRESWFMSTLDLSFSNTTRHAFKTARPWLLGVAAAFAVGTWMAGISTADFVAHLDRQVHAIHCGLLPGLAKHLGDSGCRTAMMSTYSSFFRQFTWGGLPVALLAFAVFAYGTFRSFVLSMRQRISKRTALFVVVMAALPLLMSVIYGTIAWVTLGSFCRVCIGIYLMSIAGFVCALQAYRYASSEVPEPYTVHLTWFLQGVAYVVLLSGLYLAMKPDVAKSAAGCGTLVKSDDGYNVMIPFGNPRGADSIAVLDPLCSACKAFDARLQSGGLVDDLQLRTILFPLDSSCNWMIKETLHPGACAVSEAVLCAEKRAPQLLAWAFKNQTELLELGHKSDIGLRSYLAQQFPNLQGCLGSAAVRNKLNRGLRWAVANALPILTPQLFVGNKRLCDEDTDLGLDFTVAHMLKSEQRRGVAP